ncbi:MAG: signal peptide peptidase SppA [Chloroflexota bacterium]
MSEIQNSSPSFFKLLTKEISDLWRDVRFDWQRTTVNLSNSIKRARFPKIDYVVMPLFGGLPERDAPPLSFIQRQLPINNTPSLSVETLMRRFKAIEESENVSGVLLNLQGIGGGLATFQSVRQGIVQLKEAGKTVVVYTTTLSLGHYFLAVAADKIIIPPSASFDVLGFHGSLSFYKDLLDKFGVELEGFQISPYKSAVDPYTKSDISPELEEMTNWLLDERYDLLVTAVSQGRNMSVETVKSLIDNAPMSANEALANGLVDHLGYEDQLEEILSGKHIDSPENEINEDVVTETEEASDEDDIESDEETAVQLMLWNKAAPFLTEKPKRRHRKFVGIVSLEGAIMRGRSQDSPINLPIPIVGGGTSGDLTLTAVLRQAIENDNIAALVFFVNSPGGDALASDIIGREIGRIAEKIPVVIYMGDVAASGGYYVSAISNHIVAQAGTITGSIGVVSAKPTLDGVNEKLGITQVEISRGENSGIYSSTKALTESQKEKFFDNIKEIYRQFKEVVSRGREIPFDDLDPICLGRVWTGRQALEHNLVDSLGSIQDAIEIAAELAELPMGEHDQVSVRNIYGKGASYQLPKSLETAEFFTSIFTQKAIKSLINRPLMLMPFDINLSE